jgi:hypothetical protein
MQTAKLRQLIGKKDKKKKKKTASAGLYRLYRVRSVEQFPER